MGIVVQKYGGSSVADADGIKRVAQRIVNTKKQGHEVVVVEAEHAPGGRAGRIDRDGYTFDTGPTVLTMRGLLDDVVSAAGGDLDALLDTMHREAEAHGRDPAAIEVIWGGEGVMDASIVDRAAELAAKGVTRLVVPGFLFWGDPEESLARFGEEVVAPLAGA